MAYQYVPSEQIFAVKMALRARIRDLRREGNFNLAIGLDPNYVREQLDAAIAALETFEKAMFTKVQK